MLLNPHRPVLHLQVGQAHCGIILARARGALQRHHRLEGGSVGGAPRHARGLDHMRERYIRVLDRVLDHALGTLQELQERGQACDATPNGMAVGHTCAATSACADAVLQGELASPTHHAATISTCDARACQIRAEGGCVHEVADEALQLWLRPVRHGCAHDDVDRAAVAP